MPDKPLPPGGTVGILGGGQLGRMLAMAAARLGLRVTVFAPDAHSPAFDVAAHRLCAPYDDAAALDAFAHQANVVTLEFENVPVKTVEMIERQTRVFPSRRALAVTQDRIAEKRFIASLGLPLGAWEPVEGAGALREALARLDLSARAPETPVIAPPPSIIVSTDGRRPRRRDQLVLGATQLDELVAEEEELWLTVLRDGEEEDIDVDIEGILPEE